jgi:hypothetical protein
MNGGPSNKGVKLMSAALPERRSQLNPVLGGLRGGPIA